MAVYVDNFDFPYGRMLMSHMNADTQEELLLMVRKIGVKEKWIQYKGTKQEHFDVCKQKKELAIANGAILVDRIKLARAVLSRETNNSKIIIQ